MSNPDGFEVRFARPEETPVVLQLIRELAEYERLQHKVVATEDQLRDSLFGSRPSAEVLLGLLHGEPVGFALFFRNFSTFLGRPGIYLEDLFVRPHARGRGLGKCLLQSLAQLALERNCGRLEWAVLDWNQPAIDFYLSQGAEAQVDWTTFRMDGDSLAHLARADL